MKNNKLQWLIEGAIIAIIYCVLMLIFRFTQEPDGLVILVFPIPIMVYVLRRGIIKSIYIVIIVSLLSLFIVGNIYYSISIIIPYIIASFIFGLLDKKNIKRSLTFIIMFIIFAAIDIFQTFYLAKVLYELDFTSYINEIVTSYSSVFSFISTDILTKAIYITLPVSFILFAVIRIVFAYTIYIAIAIRLNLKSRTNFQFSVKKSTRLLEIYIAFILLLIVFSIFIFMYTNIILYAFYIAFYSIFAILSLYYIFVGILYLKSLYSSDKWYINVLIGIIAIILFPITIIFGIIGTYKLKNRNYVIA